LFAFKYSDRPNAKATGYTGKVPEKEKAQRLQILLDRQQGITLEKNQVMEGTKQVVLVEGVSRKSAKSDIQWMGRTPNNKIVNFVAPQPFVRGGGDLIGRQVSVSIQKGLLHSLLGTALP
jgi:tRNA-2-methylthio-N6-dimethylallyladenosine synthase